MAFEWRKPVTVEHFTDLCIWVDENKEKIKNPGEFPDIEDKVVNYIWLVTKALAIKKCMFQNFDDYDPYCFYTAKRVFFALRKNLNNEGKTVKGKTIAPIKSVLNYLKSVMKWAKMEYQEESFREVISQEYSDEQFDAMSFRANMAESALASQGVTDRFKMYLQDEIDHSYKILDQILEDSVFGKNTEEYKNIKISMLLNIIYSVKKKNMLSADLSKVILWKLPKNMTKYVKMMLQRFYTKLKDEIVECASAVEYPDNIVSAILNSAYDAGDNSHEDND